jgi:hypothetical protein
MARKAAITSGDTPGADVRGRVYIYSGPDPQLVALFLFPETRSLIGGLSPPFELCHDCPALMCIVRNPRRANCCLRHLLPTPSC